MKTEVMSVKYQIFSLHSGSLANTAVQTSPRTSSPVINSVATNQIPHFNLLSTIWASLDLPHDSLQGDLRGRFIGKAPIPPPLDNVLITQTNYCIWKNVMIFLYLTHLQMRNSLLLSETYCMGLLRTCGMSFTRRPKPGQSLKQNSQQHSFQRTM